MQASPEGKLLQHKSVCSSNKVAPPRLNGGVTLSILQRVVILTIRVITYVSPTDERDIYMSVYVRAG